MVQDPQVHHAVHLSKVRDQCKKNCMGILKSYKTALLNDFPLISINKLLFNIQQTKPKPNPKQIIDKIASNKSPLLANPVVKNSTSKGPKPEDDVEVEVGDDVCFDDFDAIESSEAEKHIKGDEKKSFTSSVWSTLTGGKSNKFKV